MLPENVPQSEYTFILPDTDMAVLRDLISKHTPDRILYDFFDFPHECERETLCSQSLPVLFVCTCQCGTNFYLLDIFSVYLFYQQRFMVLIPFTDFQKKQSHFSKIK